MNNPKPQRDFYSGVPWVYVTPSQARGHPKGQLGIVLWVIALYFIGIGVMKFWFAIDYGETIGLAILTSIWPFLTGVGLALRVPWSVIMAIVSAGLTLWMLIRGVAWAPGVLGLGELLVTVGILFHLIDGDRPNLIYRHRYRKYSVDDQDAADDKTA